MERCHFSGQLPFEVLQIKAKPDGFQVIYTEEVDKATAIEIKNYLISSYTYIYQSGYGSPVVDKSTPTIKSATLSCDNKIVYLKIDGLVKGNIHEINFPGVKNLKGENLLHAVGYYTLNEIPSS